jgi:hypothetical protein
MIEITNQKKWVLGIERAANSTTTPNIKPEQSSALSILHIHLHAVLLPPSPLPSLYTKLSLAMSTLFAKIRRLSFNAPLTSRAHPLPAKTA